MDFPETLGNTLHARLEEGDGPTVYALSGELDYQVSEAFVGRVRGLLSTGGRDLVLDMAEMSFIDSTGLRALLEIRSCVPDGSRRITLRRVQAPVQRVLGLTDLSGQFRITERS